MIGHLRVRSPWSQLGIFFGLLGGAYIVTFTILSVVLIAKGIKPPNFDFNDPAVLGTLKWIQGISSITIFFLPAFFYAKICATSDPLRFLGLKSFRKPSYFILLAIACIVIAFPFVAWIGELNQRIPLPQWMRGLEDNVGTQMEAFLKAKSTFDVIVNVFLIGFLPAICEEICFRGALQRILIHIFRSPITGIIVTAILFSALHMQFQGFLPRMFLGALLGFMYWYSGSLWPGIAAHFVNNAVQVVVVSYAPEYINKNPQMPFLAAFASIVFVLVILYFYRSNSTVTYEKVYEPDELNRTNEFIA
jgi:uncharacterized protein